MVGRLNKNSPDGTKSQQLYYQMLDKYFSNALSAKNGNGFLAAHTIFFPVEILYAMGITPLHNEVTTWTSALLLGNQMEFLTAGAEAGLAPEICSPHRGLAGGYYRNLLPKPDAVLWTNLICDNTAKSGEYIMELTGCPGYFLDHPFDHSRPEKNYMVEELKDMIQFLEKTSGSKMDWDKLSQNVAEMDKQIKLQAEICELRKAVPSPFPTRRFLEFLTVDYMFASQPEATEYLKAFEMSWQKWYNQQRRGQSGTFPFNEFFLSPDPYDPFSGISLSGIRGRKHGRTSLYLLEIRATQPLQAAGERSSKVLPDTRVTNDVRTPGKFYFAGYPRLRPRI